jgi:hypothetical protein
MQSRGYASQGRSHGRGNRDPDMRSCRTDTNGMSPRGMSAFWTLLFRRGLLFFFVSLYTKRQDAFRLPATCTSGLHQLGATCVLCKYMPCTCRPLTNLRPWTQLVVIAATIYSKRQTAPLQYENCICFVVVNRSAAIIFRVVVNNGRFFPTMVHQQYVSRQLPHRCSLLRAYYPTYVKYRL